MEHNFCDGTCTACGERATPSGAQGNCPGTGWGAEIDPGADERPLASLSDRFFGQVLDGVLSALLAIAIGISAFLLPEGGEVFGFGLGLFSFYYYRVMCDGFSGRSLGKRLMGTQVVQRVGGDPCGFWRSFLRNFLLYTCLGIFDVIFIFGRNRRRLGDLFAGTIVVELPKGVAPARLEFNAFTRVARPLFQFVLVVGIGFALVQTLRSLTRSDVLVFNALPVPVVVQLGEQQHTVASGDHIELEDFNRGEYSVSVTTLAGELLEESELSVPGHHDVVAYNVLGAAPLFLEEEIYGDARGALVPSYTDLVGERLVTQRSVDFVLELSPAEVYSGSRGYRKIVVFGLRDGGWVTSLESLAESGELDRWRQLAARVEELRPGDESSAEKARATLATIDSWEFFDEVYAEALGQFPRSAGLRRTHQDRLLWYGESREARLIYREALAEDPESEFFGYLNARLAPPEESLALTEELLERFPDSSPILARHGWALHQLGEFARAQPFLARALLNEDDWNLELLATAARNLVALDREDEALDLATEFNLASEVTTHEFVVLYAQLHHVMGGPASPLALRRASRDCYGDLSEDMDKWLELYSGMKPRASLQLSSIVDTDLRCAIALSRTLEVGPREAVSALNRMGNWEVGVLDEPRRVALACAVLADGDREMAASILNTVAIPPHILEDTILGEEQNPYAAALPWEMRALIELSRGVRHPEGSSERAEHFERARAQDFMQGLARRAADRW